jgi:hypothetical protein
MPIDGPMKHHEAAAWALAALVMSAASGTHASGPARVDRQALGGGWIAVFGEGVSVRVTDPRHRFAEWDGVRMSNGLPRCSASGEERVADEEDSWEDRGPETTFMFYRLTPGDYRIEIRARRDVEAHLSVSRHSYLHIGRDSIRNPRASADTLVTLRKGQRTTWMIDWGCTEASDTCWASLRQVKGARSEVVGH